MSESTERLYHLLPALYRITDEQNGEPLRALMGVIEGEVQALQADIAQLYDNWFIETCEDWVVPYIGDLVGLRALLSVDPHTFSMRAHVANTIPNRRRKGTPGALEQVARDVSGWQVRVFEYFQQVLTAQHSNNIRPSHLRTPHLRFQTLVPVTGSAFDTTSRTPEVRQMSAGGRYNLPNLGIMIWRLKSYAAPYGRAVEADSEAETLPDSDGGFYRFSRLGHDMPLFNRPQERTDGDALAREIHLPIRLTRRALYQDLNQDPDTAAESAWVGPGRAIEVEYQTASGNRFAVPAHELLASDLTTQLVPVPPSTALVPSWRRPTSVDGRLTFERVEGTLELPQTVIYPRVGVDPVLGRLALPSPEQLEPEIRDSVQWPTALYVRSSYGAVGELGGGPYDRRKTLALQENRTRYLVPTSHATLVLALAQWAADGYPDALIELTDSSTYGSTPLLVPEGKRLEIRSENQEMALVDPALATPPAQAWEVTLAPRASLTLDGVGVVGGPLLVTGSGDGTRSLSLKHCTLVPGHRLHWNGEPTVTPETSSACQSIVVSGAEMDVSLFRCIAGPLEMPETEGTLTLQDCLIDGLGSTSTADSANQPSAILNAFSVTIRASTVLGSSSVHQLMLGSNSILTGPLTVKRRQEGCIRYCYAHEASVLPRRYACIPVVEGLGALEAALTAGKIRPRFTARHYGQPGYGQLVVPTPDALRTGADDEGEMGVLHFLHQPAREANLRATLDEYLPIGLEAGFAFAT